MSPSVEDLHARFSQQATWTSAIRRRLFELPQARAARRILEVGSGTGAITLDLHRLTGARVTGIDRDHGSNRFAAVADPHTRLATARGERLPFSPGAFDLTCCHFLLLWVEAPALVLREMRRVTRPGGPVFCLAEPDYGGRVVHPAMLAALGEAQENSLRRQGADTRLGRRLRQLLVEAGLASVEVGVLGGEWRAGGAHDAVEAELEWRTLADDLRAESAPSDLERLHGVFSAARSQGSHVLFIPTFYGWGIRPE